MSTSARSLDSYQLFWEDNTQKELLLVKEWGVFDSKEICKIWQKIDDDLERWILAKILMTNKKNIPKTKIEYKHMNAKKRRKTEFAMLQNCTKRIELEQLIKF